MPAKKTAYFAYAWASGQIEIGPRVPDGALGFARHNDQAFLRRIVGSMATFTQIGIGAVPGILHNSKPYEAIKALAAFSKEVSGQLERLKSDIGK